MLCPCLLLLCWYKLMVCTAKVKHGCRPHSNPYLMTGRIWQPTSGKSIRHERPMQQRRSRTLSRQLSRLTAQMQRQKLMCIQPKSLAWSWPSPAAWGDHYCEPPFHHRRSLPSPPLSSGFKLQVASSPDQLSAMHVAQQRQMS